MVNATQIKIHNNQYLSTDQKNISKNPSIKILIVEDNFLTQCAIKQMLIELGYCADFAEDGKNALALYHPQYKLILMDIELPDFTGIEATKIIRKMEKEQYTPHVPIVAMTSHYDEPEYQKKCLAAGMTCCSNKPTLAQLKQWISEYVMDQCIH
jgi:CheY-like chemotaxis protein